MAVTGKTADFEIPFYEQGDSPPNMGTVTQKIAERVNAILKSIKGDATLAIDGTLTAKDHSASLYQEPAVTRKSEAAGSFSTPIKLPLPRVKENQQLEVILWGLVKASIETKKEGQGGYLGLALPGGASAELLDIARIQNLATQAANTFIAFGSGGTQGYLGGANSLLLPKRGQLAVATFAPVSTVLSANEEGGAVELIGKCTGGGTITVEKVWMMARVSGGN